MPEWPAHRQPKPTLPSMDPKIRKPVLDEMFPKGDMWHSPKTPLTWTPPKEARKEVEPGGCPEAWPAFPSSLDASSRSLVVLDVPGLADTDDMSRASRELLSMCLNGSLDRNQGIGTMSGRSSFIDRVSQSLGGWLGIGGYKVDMVVIVLSTSATLVTVSKLHEHVKAHEDIFSDAVLIMKDWDLPREAHDQLPTFLEKYEECEYTSPNIILPFRNGSAFSEGHGGNPPDGIGEVVYDRSRSHAKSTFSLWEFVRDLSTPAAYLNLEQDEKVPIIWNDRTDEVRGPALV